MGLIMDVLMPQQDPNGAGILGLLEAKIISCSFDLRTRAAIPLRVGHAAVEFGWPDGEIIGGVEIVMTPTQFFLALLSGGRRAQAARSSPMDLASDS